MEPWVRDEVLILLATIGACALLILGVLELLWPSRPRGRRWASHAGASPAEPMDLPREPTRESLAELARLSRSTSREPRSRASRALDLR